MTNLRIEVVQSKGVYFWALVADDLYLAHSQKIDTREAILTEAREVAEELTLDVAINERS